jgi:hypothetical protein
MTDHTPAEGGTPPPFKKVEDHAQFERAPAPREPVRNPGDPNLAFEAVPIAPPPPEPPAKLPAFEAVPASLNVAQQRLSTASIGLRPEAPDVAGPVRPGGSGWNIRPRDQPWMPKGRHAAPADGPGWNTRTLPNANRDRSAWMVPDAVRMRRLSRLTLVKVVLVLILLTIVGFAGYQWLAGRSHPAHATGAPSSVGALTAIHAPAAVAITWQVLPVAHEQAAPGIAVASD